MSRRGKSIEAGSRQAVPGTGGGGDREGLLMGAGFPFGVMKAIYN